MFFARTDSHSHFPAGADSYTGGNSYACPNPDANTDSHCHSSTYGNATADRHSAL